MAKGLIRKVLAVTVLGVLVVAGCSESDADKQKKAAMKAEKEAAAQRQAEFDKKRGFHCLSSWDGSNRGVEQWLKKNLRDPDSYQHIETKITPVKDGAHSLISQYRAKNGFGGYTTGTVIAKVDHNTCQVTVLANS